MMWFLRASFLVKHSWQCSHWHGFAWGEFYGFTRLLVSTKHLLGIVHTDMVSLWCEFLCVSPSYLYLQNIFLECWHWYSFSLGWILYSLARWSHHLLFLSTRGMVSSWIWGGDITSFDELKGEGQRHFFFQTCSLLMLILVLKPESECWIGLIWG